MDYHVFSLSEEAKTALWEHIDHILSRHQEIVFAYGHGSFVHETHFRDIDIAVFLRPELLPRQTFAYEDQLAQEIIQETGIPFPVDMRILNQKPVPFQYHVIQGKLLLERDEEARVEWIEHTLGRYFDIRPVLAQAFREVFDHES